MHVVLSFYDVEQKNIGSSVGTCRDEIARLLEESASGISNHQWLVNRDSYYPMTDPWGLIYVLTFLDPRKGANDCVTGCQFNIFLRV